MSFNAYLQLDGIDGEATDAEHKKWIPLLGLDFGVDLPILIDRNTGGPSSTNRANFHELTLTKGIDAATPKLYANCAGAKVIDKAKIEIARGLGGKLVKPIVIELEKVYITSVDTLASAAVHRVPVEIITLNYGTIKWTYTASDLTKGAAGGNVEFKWDLVANKSA
ncbi:hypothetical protein FACS1894139_18580 [Planctomycetales bacterium]|nr:hypothetical protein FACS1894107_11020 [Planctomycetales bacterium]GHS99467.1 hypothetical protein FACS1894108_09500 [Planctomycetales bacterium]GHT08661.1 hypothetical protein FACS1894139_18580 [Planctomycetales bacterium]